MKIILSLVFLFITTISIAAQNNLVEREFEQNKKNYTRVKFSFGEDASSGWDYLVYRKKSEIKKIRVIGSNYTNNVTVDDFYFLNGKPLLFVSYAAQKKQYKALIKGQNLALKQQEKLYFADNKLTTWIDKGKLVDSKNQKWTDKEIEVLERFKGEVESFESYLKGEL